MALPVHLPIYALLRHRKIIADKATVSPCHILNALILFSQCHGHTQNWLLIWCLGRSALTSASKPSPNPFINELQIRRAEEAKEGFQRRHHASSGGVAIPPRSFITLYLQQTFCHLRYNGESRFKIIASNSFNSRIPKKHRRNHQHIRYLQSLRSRLSSHPRRFARTPPVKKARRHFVQSWLWSHRQATQGQPFLDVVQVSALTWLAIGRGK